MVWFIDKEIRIIAKLTQCMRRNESPPFIPCVCTRNCVCVTASRETTLAGHFWWTPEEKGEIERERKEEFRWIRRLIPTRKERRELRKLEITFLLYKACTRSVYVRKEREGKFSLFSIFRRLAAKSKRVQTHRWPKYSGGSTIQWRHTWKYSF